MTDLLRAEEIAFAYPQHGRGVQPVSLRLNAGEILHLHSPSGGGKSTLARCLTGIIPHLYRGQLHGAIWLAGQRTDQTALWQLTETAGMVFQNPAAQMLAASVEEELIFGLENLGLAGAEIERRVVQALEQFGLQDFRPRSPLSLSGGEQQKLALAAVMARRPPLLVLDEPLSMLDSTAAFDLVAALAALAGQGTAIVICEHRREYLSPLPHLHRLRLPSPPGEAERVSVPFPGSGEEPGARGLALHARDLRVTRGGRTILDGWDIDLPGGQITAIVGRNGSGKTTLFRALAGLQSYSGQVSMQVDGRDKPPRLGLVFQNPDLQLFNASVQEEICYGLASPDPALYAWLVAALRLDSHMHTPPLLLSEGEKRRVALATLLMRQPPHGILLDEPALGQDQSHKTLLLDLLRACAQTGRIVAYSTHDIELAAQADRLILLGPTNGILAMGAPGDLLRQPGAWQQAGLRLPDWITPPC